VNDADERTKQRAIKAKQLFDDPMLKEAFITLEEGFMTQMAWSQVDDVKAREQARYKIEALRLVQQELKHVMESGKMIVKAEENLEQMKSFRAAEGRGNV